MASIASILPAPARSYEVYSDARKVGPSTDAASKVPEYPHRKGWVPKAQTDFGDGGAYPELLVAQYPLDMGRPGKATSTAIVPVTLDTGSGKARFDAVITAQHHDKALVHTRFTDLAEKNANSVVKPRPTEEEEIEAAARTRAALEGIVTTKISHSRPGYVPTEAISRAEQSKYVRYTPAEDTNGYSEATSQRIIRMVEAPVDPFEPPKFRHKKVPGGPPDAPVPLMHSPPRKLTVADQQAWSVPVCVSNWKNARGYVVPLDKRLAADGRSLLEPTINDKFATFSESLLIAERKARVEVETRAAIERKLALKEKEEKETELRDLALKARLERTGVAPPAARAAATAAVEELYEGEPGSPAHLPPQRREEEGLSAPAGRAPGETAQEYAARQEREVQRRERKRERERDLRMDNMTGKRARTMKDDEDRDVSEKIALGLAVGRGTAGGAEAAFDSRLFNQSEGISTGLGDEDAYNVYSKAWRSEAAGSSIYRPRTTAGGELSAADADAQIKELQSSQRFKGSTDFEGVERGAKISAGRSEPVQFEKHAAADVFGLDQFLTTSKRGASGKSALDSIGKSGFMSATAGSASRAPEDLARSSRSSIAFTSSGTQ